MTKSGLRAVGSAAAATAIALTSGVGAQETATPDPQQVFAGVTSGTARAPLSVGMSGFHTQLGPWAVMTHGFANLNVRWDDEPRGERDVFSTSMLMVSGRRALGGGFLELTAMASGEPYMGSRGYSLLLQTGETADGINPLVDRQHPHDAVMELSATYHTEVDAGAWGFLYVAPVGSPAVGPVPFMHRASGAENPVAPLSHHFLDATHISYGVLTVGLFVDQRFQLELSGFNGSEPDQHRWGLQAPAINSFAARVTLTPGRAWALQGSFASLRQPEQLHPEIDFYRMTLSAMHHVDRPWGSWATTIAVGRNIRRETTMTLGEARARLSAPLLAHYVDLAALPPGADDSWLLLFERRENSAVLAETTVRRGPAAIFGRFEHANKDELFAPPDMRHSELFSITKIDVGAVYDLLRIGSADIGFGASASLHFLAGELDAAYGRRPTSFMLFTRAQL